MREAGLVVLLAVMTVVMMAALKGATMAEKLAVSRADAMVEMREGAKAEQMAAQSVVLRVVWAKKTVGNLVVTMVV